jgi:superfamily II RNA helicase
MEKFDGARFRPLTGAEVKQIAGRAGRYGSRYGSGHVTCMHQVSNLFDYFGNSIRLLWSF